MIRYREIAFAIGLSLISGMDYSGCTAKNEVIRAGSPADAARILKVEEKEIMEVRGMYITKKDFQYLRAAGAILSGKADPRLENGKCVSSGLAGPDDYVHIDKAAKIAGKGVEENYITHKRASETFSKICNEGL